MSEITTISTTRDRTKWEIFIVCYIGGVSILGASLSLVLLDAISGRQPTIRALGLLSLAFALLGLALWLSPRPSLTARLIIPSTVMALSGFIAAFAIPNRLPLAIASGMVFALLVIAHLRVARGLTRRSS